MGKEQREEKKKKLKYKIRLITIVIIYVLMYMLVGLVVWLTTILSFLLFGDNWLSLEAQYVIVSGVLIGILSGMMRLVYRRMKIELVYSDRYSRVEKQEYLVGGLVQHMVVSLIVGLGYGVLILMLLGGRI